MSRRLNPSLPRQPFGLLLVEGGDERALCEAIAGPTTWAGLFCWTASGRQDLKNLAALARLDPNFVHARSVGLVLDVEDDLQESLRIVADTLAALGHHAAVAHGILTEQSPQLGVFLAPDGATPGSIELLCRQAVRDPRLAACVDSLVACAQPRHSTVALAAKGWLNAYLAMLPEQQRFHQTLVSGKGAIDVSHPVFEPLRHFLHSL